MHLSRLLYSSYAGLCAFKLGCSKHYWSGWEAEWLPTAEPKTWEYQSRQKRETAAGFCQMWLMWFLSESSFLDEEFCWHAIKTLRGYEWEASISFNFKHFGFKGLRNKKKEDSFESSVNPVKIRISRSHSLLQDTQHVFTSNAVGGVSNFNPTEFMFWHMSDWYFWIRRPLMKITKNVIMMTGMSWRHRKDVKETHTHTQSNGEMMINPVMWNHHGGDEAGVDVSQSLHDTTWCEGSLLCDLHFL